MEASEGHKPSNRIHNPSGGICSKPGIVARGGGPLAKLQFHGSPVRFPPTCLLLIPSTLLNPLHINVGKASTPHDIHRDGPVARTFAARGTPITEGCIDHLQVHCKSSMHILHYDPTLPAPYSQAAPCPCSPPVAAYLGTPAPQGPCNRALRQGAAEKHGAQLVLTFIMKQESMSWMP